jgi:uncharacterized membrane protein
MIFGLALSVGAITLVSSPPTDPSGVYGALLTFGFSFLILIVIWLRYTRIMSVLHLESQRAIRLNIALLFLVSVEPFLFNIVRSPPSGLLAPGTYEDVTSSLYALDLGAMMLILGGFTFSLTSEDKNLIPRDLIHHFKLDSFKLFVSGALFMATVLPFFFTTKVGESRSGTSSGQSPCSSSSR